LWVKSKIKSEPGSRRDDRKGRAYRKFLIALYDQKENMKEETGAQPALE
jgi:hypothetical protein